MSYLTREKFQLGQTSFFLGDWPNLLAGALEMSIYACPSCRHLEFFMENSFESYEGDKIAKKSCPKCGMSHEMDFVKCPFCKYDYR